MHEYAILEMGITILLAVQMESHGVLVNNKLVKAGGGQTITMREGHVIPVKFSSGLPYLAMRPPTDLELATLPHT